MTTVFHWNGRLYADSRAMQGHRVVDNTLKLMGDIRTLTGAAGTIAGMHSFLNMFYEILQKSHIKNINHAIREITRAKYKTCSCSESFIIMIHEDQVYKFNQEVSIRRFGRNRARWMLVQTAEVDDCSDIIAIGSGKSYIREYFANVGPSYFDPYEALNYACYRDQYTGGYMVSKGLDSAWVETKKLIDPQRVWSNMVANRMINDLSSSRFAETLYRYVAQTSSS